jgi:hypothetical protein
LYEVRKINHIVCLPYLDIILTENGGNVTRSTFSGEYTHPLAIQMQTLGIFDLPITLFEDRFIQRVTDLAETYYYPASKMNFPQKGFIGDIQLADITDTKFKFNEDVFECQDGIATINCLSTFSPLDDPSRLKPFALPKTIGQHQLRIKPNGQVFSVMTDSSAIKVHMTFSKYKVTLSNNRICPHLDQELTLTGCFKCQTPALLQFTAHSTCLPGSITAYLLSDIESRKFILITTIPETYTFEFSTENKCIDTQFCLMSTVLTKCVPIVSCLDEPVVHLTQPNVTLYTITMNTTQNGLDFSFSSMINSILSFIPNFFGDLWYIMLNIVLPIICVLVIIIILTYVYSFLRLFK